MTEQQIVLAAELTTSTSDWSQLEPMVSAAVGELDWAGVAGQPEVALADAQYWNEEHIDAVVAERHIQVLIPPESRTRDQPRPGWTGGRYDWMCAVLKGQLGDELYRKRVQMVEPVFGQTKHNRGVTRFHRRGRKAVRTEWRLVMATHNLMKLFRHQLALASEPHTAEQAGLNAARSSHEPHSEGRSLSGALADPRVCCQQGRGLRLEPGCQIASGHPGRPVCLLDAGISPAGSRCAAAPRRGADQYPETPLARQETSLERASFFDLAELLRLPGLRPKPVAPSGRQTSRGRSTRPRSLTISFRTRVTDNPVLTLNSGPQSGALGPDGAIWFVERNANKIGRMTLDGAFTEYSLTPDSFPKPDRRRSRWRTVVTELNTDKIGRITTRGTLSEYPINGGPVGITVVPSVQIAILRRPVHRWRSRPRQPRGTSNRPMGAARRCRAPTDHRRLRPRYLGDRHIQRQDLPPHALRPLSMKTKLRHIGSPAYASN